MNRLFDAAQPYLYVLGRLLISPIFILSGISKISNFAATAKMMAGKGLPLPEFLLVLTILIEVCGGVMLLLGIYARLTALVFFVWLIPVTAAEARLQASERRFHEHRRPCPPCPQRCSLKLKRW